MGIFRRDSNYICLGKVKGKSTLTARRIVNLTGVTLSVYDNIGDVVDLPPEKLKFDRSGKLPLLPDNVFYIIDRTVDQGLTNLLKDSEYKNAIVIPVMTGTGRNGEKICRLVATNRHFFVIPRRLNHIAAAW